MAYSRLATLDPGKPGLGVIERGAVAVNDGSVREVGGLVETAIHSHKGGF